MTEKLTNQHILDEIHNRIRRANKLLDRNKLHPEIKDALEKVEAVGEEAILAIQKDLEKTFRLWGDKKYSGRSADVTLAAAGFSWYYDGQYYPDPMGYGITEFNPVKQPMTESARFKDGFLSGGAIKGKTMGDTGGFDMAPVTAAFHDIVIQDDNPRYEVDEDFEGFEYEDEVENLVILKLALILNEAFLRAARSDAFNSFKHNETFYLLANNHDNEKFIVAMVE